MMASKTSELVKPLRVVRYREDSFDVVDANGRVKGFALPEVEAAEIVSAVNEREGAADMLMEQIAKTPLGDSCRKCGDSTYNAWACAAQFLRGEVCHHMRALNQENAP